MNDPPDATTPVAIVLAGGSGSRIGVERPKQLLDLHGRPVFVHAVALYAGLGHHIVIVAAPHVRDEMAAVMARHLPDVRASVVMGGRNRQLSVVAGVRAIPDATADDTAVILHNAASPNTPPSLVSACVRALADHDAVQAYIPSNVTTVLHANGQLIEMIPRAASGFTADPTVYRRRLIAAIGRTLVDSPEGGETTIDIALRLGARVGLLESPIDNLKITLPGDLLRVSRSMHARG